MVRLAISVEGQTEERFVKKLLVPHFETTGIYVTPVLLGRSGGDVSLPRIKKDLNMLAQNFDTVTTFYDFYGFRGKTADDNKTTLEQKIHHSVAESLRSKIIPYLQMYEFEGLLFTVPEVLEQVILQAGLSNWASGILHNFNNNPEAINDYEQTAPSKRLQRQTDYLKTVHGPMIVQTIGLDVLRTRCKGFGLWLNTLEGLAKYSA